MTAGAFLGRSNGKAANKQGLKISDKLVLLARPLIDKKGPAASHASYSTHVAVHGNAGEALRQDALVNGGLESAELCKNPCWRRIDAFDFTPVGIVWLKNGKSKVQSHRRVWGIG